MKKLVNIEIVPDTPVHQTKDEAALCTTVQLTYKPKIFSSRLKFETAYPSGSYRVTGNKNFDYFFFVNELGEHYDEETCRKITAYLEKEKLLGNLKIKK